MNAENPRERLKEYNVFFQQHANFNTSVPKVCNIVYVIHLVAWIVFLANLYALTKWECLANFSTIPILKDIPLWMPFYSSNVWIFLLCGIITVFVILGFIGKKITLVIWNKTQSYNINTDNEELQTADRDILKLFEECDTKFKPSGPGCTGPAVEILTGIVLGFMIGHILGLLLVVAFTAIADFIFLCITFSFQSTYEEKFNEFTQ